MASRSAPALEPGHQGAPARLGPKLRALRKRSGLTLATLNERCGVPVSSLSKIETDQLSPTYDQLVKISSGLGIDIAALFSGVTADPGGASAGRRSLNRAGDGQILESREWRLAYLCTDLLGKDFSPVVTEVFARSGNDPVELHSHDGQEFIYVLEGELEFHSEFYAPTLMKPGDSVYFDAGMKHSYRNHGKGTCQFLSICSAPRPEGHKL